MRVLPEVELSSDEQKVSYGFGLQFGDQLRRNNFNGLDLEAVVAGIRHWYQHQQAALTDAELNPSYQVVQDRQKALAAELDSKRQALAEQFMQANAVQPGPRSTVVTHYHGTFVDGTVFDSSVDRGQPAEFGVHEVIPGWTEALQMMSVGDKWRIACPPKLAYGERGAGDSIPPNTALVFEIHLIDIKD